MIKILHCADLHLGMENYGRMHPSGVNSRVVDFLTRLDEMTNYALDNDADVFLFAGDAFKTRSPNPTLTRAFAGRMVKLARAGVQVVLLAGNHDIPASHKSATTLDIFRVFDLRGITMIKKPEWYRFKTRSGNVDVLAIPYPMRNRLLVRDEYRGSQEESARAIQDYLAEKIETLKRYMDPAFPSIFVGHFTVAGAVWGSERSVLLGSDIAIPLGPLADEAFDYVALGHIHKHQVVHDYPPIVYSGSPARVDFGEEADPKGFCWVETDGEHTEWSFVPTQAREFVTIDVDVRESEYPTNEIVRSARQHRTRDAVVRIRVLALPGQSGEIEDDRIVEELDGAHYLSIEREIERHDRARLAGTKPEGMTPRELLEAYLASRDVDESVARDIVDEANRVFEEVKHASS